jgi:indole-3-glycerol phosphate synthase
MILDEIVARKKEDIRKYYQQYSLDVLAADCKKIMPAPSFKRAIAGKQHLSVIAEVKKASPSRGVLRESFDPVAIAKEFVELKASALSVLTEEHFFRGSLDYLRAISQTVTVPLLCKDFIIDPIQVYLAKKNGASAILLIAAILDMQTFRDLQRLARELDLDVLAEVHNEFELGMVLHTSADIIGINNRNLKDFSIDLSTTTKLLPLIPETKVVVAESGYFSRDQIPAGLDAVLVGEGLIKSKNILL